MILFSVMSDSVRCVLSFCPHLIIYVFSFYQSSSLFCCVLLPAGGG